ncbi:cytochrome aa3 quinol oxidase subunit II [Pseudalkalibacillus sp. SCS-8]|uniref:cytochrome aa3 quinol oxidase subunit II n=1 Tax=Pseudalkalibacillus nanhaiensis TaxID=3115291 RepID=UPI0032DBD077
MKLKLALFALMMSVLTVLTGCEPLTVLDPKGPQAARLASDIWITMFMMAGIVIAVCVWLVIMLVKYRASKQPADYEPPHIEGNPWVEGILVGIPVIIVAILSVISVQSNYIVESAPKGYEDKEPLVVYASSSDWKWHFSYPEQDIETVNYLYIPTDRPLEFRLYSHGPITSFWIPQLGGQKYAMNDHVTTLHLAADVEGDFMGRNANFSGKGFAENKFDVTAMSQQEFDEWVKEVKETADPLTEEKFEELLEPGHLGRMTFTGTQQQFLPAPEHHHEGDKYEEHDKNKDGHEEKQDHHAASDKESDEKKHKNHNE